MKSNNIIDRVEALPSDLGAELLPAATQEGFGALERLRVDWEAGTNRFAEAGEAFYVARLKGRLVGVCGLNRDPYVKDMATGRIRRLYVLPEFRRKGVGRGLVQQVIEGGRRYFRIFHVRTVDPQASAVYLALGFVLVVGQESFTHEFTFEAYIKGGT